MPYHSVRITPVDLTSKRSTYEIGTRWSKFDKKDHTGEAYTLASEGHKILRWDSNDAVVPGDIIEATDWPYAAEMNAAREEQQDAFITQYIENRANRTPEQIAEENFEMRAAFGPGETVVNVLTGERTKL